MDLRNTAPFSCFLHWDHRQKCGILSLKNLLILKNRNFQLSEETCFPQNVDNINGSAKKEKLAF